MKTIENVFKVVNRRLFLLNDLCRHTYQYFFLVSDSLGILCHTFTLSVSDFRPTILYLYFVSSNLRKVVFSC